VRMFLCCRPRSATAESSSRLAASETVASPRSDSVPLDTHRSDSLDDYVSGDQIELISNKMLVYDSNVVCADVKQQAPKSNVQCAPVSISFPADSAWSQHILASTPRRSSSGTDGSLTDRTQSPSADSIDAGASSPRLLDDYWMRVAHHAMTFELGKSLTQPQLSVGKSFLNDIQIPHTDASYAYDQLMNAYYKWALSRQETVQSKRDWRRRTSSSMAVLQSQLISSLVDVYGEQPTGEASNQPPALPTCSSTNSLGKSSPRCNVLSECDIDDELRTFVGSSVTGDVPLMRMSVIRCTEVDKNRGNTPIHGIVIVDVSFADVVGVVREPFTRWLLTEIVSGDLGLAFDFVRMSNRVREPIAEIVTELVARQVYSNVAGRIIYYKPLEAVNSSTTTAVSMFRMLR